MIFLAATTLNLINPVRYLVMTMLGLDEDRHNCSREYFYVTDKLLDYWVRSFMLVLIFIVGLRKENGLWTTSLQLLSSTKG